MSTKELIIYGAGGHAQVVLDALLSKLDAPKILLVDDNPKLIGSIVCGYKVMPATICATTHATAFHVAIGGGAARRAVHEKLKMFGHFPHTIAHPSSVISPFARIGEGVFLAAQSVVAPSTKIGSGTIVNHGAIIDHDCVIGQFTHVAPNATLGGGVSVGDGVLVGAGSVVLPGCVVANEAVIGAGAVITSGVARGAIIVGVPGRDIGEGAI